MSASTHEVTSVALDMSPEERSRYLGGTRGQAVETLSQAIRDQEILVLLTGSAGVGKTVVLNAALAMLANEAIRAIRLDNPDKQAWSQRDLARQILGGPIKDPANPAADTAAIPPSDPLADCDAAAIIAELTAATAGEAPVVIAVDDAQTLTDEAMELLLLLASPARGSTRPPQLILSGRGEFWERDRRSELQLITRLAERVTLKALAGPDAMDYIAFRLRQAGGPNQVISSEALTGILHYSGGLPARIDRVLAPANSIRVCRGSRVLTGDMVEAAIATLAPAPASPFPGPASPFPGPASPFPGPASPFPGPASTVTRMVPEPFADWVAQPQPIYTASSSPDPVSSAEPSDGSTPVLDARPPGVEPSPPVLDPNSPIVVAPMFRSPSWQLPPASGGAVVPFQVETPGSATTALMVKAIAPGRRRVGRTATAVAAFAMILGSLAYVLPVPSVRLANAIAWPWSFGLTGASKVHPGRPFASMAPSGVRAAAKRAAVPEPTAIAVLAGVPSARPDAASIQPRPTSGTEPSAAPAVTLPPTAAVTTAVLPAASIGAAREQTPNAGSRSTTVAEAAPAESSVMASAAAFVPGAQSGAATAESGPVHTSQHIAGSPPTDAPVAAALSPEMVNFLLRRGDMVLQQGDVLSARLYFEQAAEAGSGQGAIGAAKTYDPVFLATIDAPGLKSDIARAIKWYRMASTAFGDRYADERLKALTAQRDR